MRKSSQLHLLLTFLAMSILLNACSALTQKTASTTTPETETHPLGNITAYPEIGEGQASQELAFPYPANSGIPQAQGSQEVPVPGMPDPYPSPNPEVVVTAEPVLPTAQLPRSTIDPNLRATDPQGVTLASGKPQLVEFFAFW